MALYSYGLYSYDIYSYGPTQLWPYIVMAYIVMTYIVMVEKRWVRSGLKIKKVVLAAHLDAAGVVEVPDGREPLGDVLGPTLIFFYGYRWPALIFPIDTDGQHFFLSPPWADTFSFLSGRFFSNSSHLWCRDHIGVIELCFLLTNTHTHTHTLHRGSFTTRLLEWLLQ